jgi:carbonic anhydrase
MSDSLIKRLTEGNRDFQKNGSVELRLRTAKEGQHPYAIVICCSDSRVIPERIFSADIGELFVIRVAGNVLDRHQMGSIEYATSHLGCSLIIMLGHTGCGAVAAALEGHSGGYVSSITDDIRAAIGDSKDPDEACRLNVIHGVERIRKDFATHPQVGKAEIRGAIYDIASGDVRWL